MLKAQMLATALNVYFSQNGNNKIGAPAPIGGVLVNVSQWSAAFGGATHMTVSQMLSYASGQWNGGTPYGSKTLTSTAINAFTAVNQSSITS